MITALLIASYILIAWGVMGIVYGGDRDNPAAALGFAWTWPVLVWLPVLIFLLTWPIWIKD